LISRSTIAAAARVIEYAAARPIVLSADLMPPSRGVAQGVEADDAKDSRANGLVAPLNGSGDTFLVYVGATGKKTDLILDLSGYFEP